MCIIGYLSATVALAVYCDQWIESVNDKHYTTANSFVDVTETLGYVVPTAITCVSSNVYYHTYYGYTLLYYMIMMVACSSLPLRQVYSTLWRLVSSSWPRSSSSGLTIVYQKTNGTIIVCRDIDDGARVKLAPHAVT